MKLRGVLKYIKDNNCKKIVIIGYPGSGKTDLALKIADKTGYMLIQTDDYKDKYDYKEQLYVILRDIIEKYEKGNGEFSYILEGVQAYRFLRKIEEKGIDYLRPDVVINCVHPNNKVENHIKKGYKTILQQYLRYNPPTPMIEYEW